jgi:cytochrome c oxidase assembly protein subunit 11
MFCQVTGYGGVPQRAEKAPGEVLDRTVTIRFDGNVDHTLPWTFAPVQQTMDVKIGDTALAFFKASNNSASPVTGRAIFNVSPELAGRYFTKIECFCFKQQTLAAGQTVEMPVTFYVDPKFVEDEDTKDISEITLSYTFYRSDEPNPPAAASAPEGDGSKS